jgi:hypothetical protein
MLSVPCPNMGVISGFNASSRPRRADGDRAIAACYVAGANDSTRQIGSMPSGPDGRGRKSRLGQLRVELPRKNSGRGFEDLIRPAEFTILPFELANSLLLLSSLSASRHRPPPGAPKCAAFPVPELAGDRAHRGPLRGGAPHHRSLSQLLRVPVWSYHRSILLRNGASREPGAVQGMPVVLKISFYKDKPTCRMRPSPASSGPG